MAAWIHSCSYCFHEMVNVGFVYFTEKNSYFPDNRLFYFRKQTAIVFIVLERVVLFY